jgi:hypothetical protein
MHERLIKQICFISYNPSGGFPLLVGNPHEKISVSEPKPYLKLPPFYGNPD